MSLESYGMILADLKKPPSRWSYLLEKNAFPKYLRDYIKVKQTGFSTAHVYNDSVDFYIHGLVVRYGDVLEVILEEFPTEDKRFFVTLSQEQAHIAKFVRIDFSYV